MVDSVVVVVVVVAVVVVIVVGVGGFVFNNNCKLFLPRSHLGV